MNTNLAFNSAQQISSFELLEKVNSFYNQAWGMLLIYITFGIFILGLIMPLLIQWAQKRFFKIEEEKIKNDMEKDIKKHIEEKFLQEQEKNKSIFDTYREVTNEKIAENEASLYHIQAFFLKKQGEYFNATQSNLDAIQSYLLCKNKRNFGRILKALKDCLSQLNAKDIEKIEVEGYDFDKTIKEIEKYDEDRSFADLISDIKSAFKIASTRA